MRKVIVTEYITLDGVMEDPGAHHTFKHSDWHFPFWSEDAMQFKFDELLAVDALLLGRRTYQEFAQAWPSATGAFADRMNRLPKYVVSSTLHEAKWNNTRVIEGNIVEAVSNLQHEAGQDILICGSGQLVRKLMQDDLIDVYRFMVHPIMAGRGASFFQDIKDRVKLQLVETKTFRKGLVLLTYEPAEKRAAQSWSKNNLA